MHEASRLEVYNTHNKPMEQLPLETVTYILSFLDSRYVYTTIPLVCREFWNICKQIPFWRLLVLRESSTIIPSCEIIPTRDCIRNIVYASQLRKWSTYFFENAFEVNFFTDTSPHINSKHEQYVNNLEQCYHLMGGWALLSGYTDWWNNAMETFSITDLRLNLFQKQFHDTYAFKTLSVQFDWQNVATYENHYPIRALLVMNKKTGQVTNVRLTSFDEECDLYCTLATKMIGEQALPHSLQKALVEEIRAHSKYTELSLMHTVTNDNDSVQYIRGWPVAEWPNQFGTAHDDQNSKIICYPSIAFKGCHTIKPILDMAFVFGVDEDDKEEMEMIKEGVKRKLDEWSESSILFPQPCTCSKKRKMKRKINI